MPQTLLHARACFPNVSQFPIPETLLPVSVFCFQDANYADATQQGILTKIRASEHLEKFCEHEQASTHLIFASSSSKGQILRALSNWMGPIDTPTSASSQANSFQILLGTTSCPGDLFNFTWLRALKVFLVSTRNSLGTSSTLVVRLVPRGVKCAVRLARKVLKS